MSYICGNYSSILSSLDCRFEALEIRRAFTVFQLMTILVENHHTIVAIEHHLLLYKDAHETTEYVSQAIRKTAKDTAILLHSPGAEPYLDELVANGDRVFYLMKGGKLR